MASLGLDSVTAFSAAPLRVATFAGLGGALLSLFMIAWAVIGRSVGGTVPGWTSLVAVVGLFGAVQLLCLGLLGEYVARLFVASQARPTYLIGYDTLQHESPICRAAPAPVISKPLPGRLRPTGQIP